METRPIIPELDVPRNILLRFLPRRVNCAVNRRHSLERQLESRRGPVIGIKKTARRLLAGAVLAGTVLCGAVLGASAAGASTVPGRQRKTLITSHRF